MAIREDVELAKSARIACEKWRQYFKYNIDEYHKNLSFILSRQWNEEEEDMLVTNKKIPLTSNKLATLSNHLVGEQQQNTPQLEVLPMENCDEETAHLRDLVVKEIMFSNNATTVYQIFGAQAIRGGFSGFLVDTDYVHAKSFDQDIVYRFFKDPTRCYWDIGAEHVNKIDGMYCGYLMRMTRESFRATYGEEAEQKILKDQSVTQSQQEIALATQPNTIGDDAFSWADGESITVNHHYKRTFKKDTLYKLSDGTVLDQDELDELIEKSKRFNQQNSMNSRLAGSDIEDGEFEMGEPFSQPPQSIANESQLMPVEDDVITLWNEGMPVRIVDSREIKRSVIMHYKIAGDFVLDESEVPVLESLPMPFADQESFYDKDGKQVCRSFFADCFDTQRYINYLRTQAAYILKVSRYDQFIGSKQNAQGADTQRNWKDPAAIQGLLTYDESPSGAKPEQLKPPELSVSLHSQYELAIQDLYTSTGLYPAALGQQGNEISAKAINARGRQGSYATNIPKNSIARAIEAGGRIVNEMIPRVYDAERVISLMTPDEGRKNITINRQADEYGERIENDIRKGTYQVRLKPGPSYEGQKEEALESLQSVITASPETFPLVADLYAENLPLSNTIELKNRLKTLVPPAVIEAGKTGKMPQESGQNQPDPAQQAMALEMQAQQADVQYKQAQIELKKEELALKQQQQQLDYEIELLKLETERLEVAGELEEQKMRFIAENERTQTDREMSHADNLVKILTHKISQSNQQQ